MAKSTVRILVVDDFNEWRVRVREMLQRPEWDIVEACDGLEAVQKATQLRPEIVLLDIGMPILNGIEAAEKIQEVTPQSKIIFVTQDGDADVKAAALATCGEAYLSKANVMSELVPAIETALQH